MNKITLLVLTFLTLVVAQPTLAQDAVKGKKIKTLVDYKAELSMTDAQITEITDALKNYQATVVAQKKLLTQYNTEYTQLLKDRAPLDEIKQKLRQVSDVSFNLRYVDVLTSRKVEDTLSTEQLTKWRSIQAKVRESKPAAK